MPVVSGTNSRGVWSKQDFVVETGDTYPKKICMNVWGVDKIKEFEAFETGEILKISFNLESREFNERWYTDVRAWRIEKSGQSNGNNAPMPAEPFDISEDGEDDLPF